MAPKIHGDLFELLMITKASYRSTWVNWICPRHSSKQPPHPWIIFLLRSFKCPMYTLVDARQGLLSKTSFKKKTHIKIIRSNKCLLEFTKHGVWQPLYSFTWELSLRWWCRTPYTLINCHKLLKVPDSTPLVLLLEHGFAKVEDARWEIATCFKSLL